MAFPTFFIANNVKRAELWGVMLLSTTTQLMIT